MKPPVIFRFRRLVRPGIFWVFLCLSTLVTPQGHAADRTYEEWRAACLKLPLNRTLGGRLPPRDLLPLQRFDEVSALLDRFFALSTNGPVGSATSWVGEAPARGTFLDVSRGWFTTAEVPFEPFAEKVVLPPGTKVLLQGDLHGDIRSFIQLLESWNQKKWVSGFKVVDPNLHVFFLGDYTDRGLYGVEVLYTLLRLRLENPEQVHLLRGNHEDVSLVSRYGFLAEGSAKYGKAFDAAKILRAYDFLPVVCYLGSGSDFVQLCHGGMEPGYSPRDLLAAAGTNRFQRLGELKQQAFVAKNPNWLGGETKAAADARRYYKDFKPMAPTVPTTLGFMWNDFTVFNDEPGFAENPDRAFVYGKSAVAFLLSEAGGTAAKVHAVIRAHQHSGLPNPMMRRLVASGGLFRHWQEKATAAAQELSAAGLVSVLEPSQTPRALAESSVWTLNVTPDSVYGANNDYRFASTGVLSLGAAFADWKLGVETVEVPGLLR